MFKQGACNCFEGMKGGFWIKMFKVSHIRWLIIGLLSTFIILVSPIESNAETYIVTDGDQLKTALEKKTSGDLVKVSNDVPLIDIGTKKINVSANKTLDLNGAILKATTGINYTYSGGLELANTTNFTDFTIQNGQIIGGSNDGLGAITNKAGFIYADPNAYKLTVTVKDIDHNNSESNGAAFFKGRGSDIIFKGDVSLYNSAFNVRALNIEMYGNPYDSDDPDNVDFYGYVDKLGWTDFHAIGEGGVNLTFDGYSVNSAKVLKKTTKNLEIPKNAKVKLVNKNNFPGYLNYANNVGNFAQMNIDGEFIAESEGTSLRTTAAFDAGNVGTQSDQSEININPSSRFKISTLNKKNTYGVIYTYNLDINVTDPEIFDIRNFGTGVFFHGWNHRNNSNLNIYKSDIAVWPKEAQGIGNPIFFWQDVLYLQLQKFNFENTKEQLRAKLRSSSPEIDANFDINSYSRISNDVALPMVISNVEEIGNNETFIDGSTNYMLPDGRFADRVAAEATVTLSVGSQRLSTVTDSNGNWSFSNLDLSSIKGGSKISLNITDSDQRNGKKATLVKVLDKLPPKGTSKLIKTLINNYDFINHPEYGVKNLQDETTSAANFNLTYLDDTKTLQFKADTLGVKELPISVKDEASNELLVTSPLLVTDNLSATGLVIGDSMTLDYDTWMTLDDANRRELIIKEGHVKGWKIAGDLVTEVTSDPKELVISYKNASWKPKDVIDVTLKVGNYSKFLKVTLKAKESKLTLSFLDGHQKIIQKEKVEVLLSGETYEVTIPTIPGFKLRKVIMNGEEVSITENKTISVKGSPKDQKIECYYDTDQFNLELTVNQSKTTQNDELTYQLVVKSHLKDSKEMYSNVLIEIPVDKYLEKLSVVEVKDSSNQVIGTGEVKENVLDIRLTKSVKQSEDLVISFKALVKNEAQTGEKIEMKASMVSTYSVNGADYQVSHQSNPVVTEIIGSLSLVSVPQTIDFGSITYSAKELVVSTPLIDKHLIVQDTRNNKGKWILNASLIKPLTCDEEELSGNIMYQTDQKELVLSRQSQPVYTSTDENQSKVDITESWSQGNRGLKLKFKATDTMKKGTYSGKIRWTLVAGPP